MPFHVDVDVKLFCLDPGTRTGIITKVENEQPTMAGQSV